MPAVSTATVKLNGQALPGAVIRAAPHTTGDGKLHGEFYVQGLAAKHNASQQQFGAGQQAIAFHRDGVDIAVLGGSVQIEDDGKQYAGRVVAVSGERVEWEEV